MERSEIAFHPPPDNDLYRYCSAHSCTDRLLSRYQYIRAYDHREYRAYRSATTFLPHERRAVPPVCDRLAVLHRNVYRDTEYQSAVHQCTHSGHYHGHPFPVAANVVGLSDRHAEPHEHRLWRIRYNTYSDDLAAIHQPLDSHRRGDGLCYPEQRRV